MIRTVDRCAKNRLNRIADDLHYGSTMFENRGRKIVEIFVQNLDDQVRLRSFDQHCEVRQVGKEESCGTALAMWSHGIGVTRQGFYNRG